MTRHFTRKTSTFTIVALFVTIVTSLVTVTAVAQVKDRAQVSAEASVVSARGASLARLNSQGQAAAPADLGSSLFLPAMTYSFPGAPFPLSGAVADLKGDGKLDIVTANFCSTSACEGDGSIGVLLGNGDGTFVSGATYDSGGWFPFEVMLADVNGDGKLDIVVANSGQDELGGGSVGILLGNGDGTFQPVVTHSVGVTLVWAIAIGDVNGDLNPDVIAATGGGVSVLLGNGDGTFRPYVPYDTGGSSTYSIGLADVNGDGKLDVVAATTVNGITGIAVLTGNGNGTFNAPVMSPNAYYVELGVIADLNGDNKPDLVVTSCLNSACVEGAVGVMLGNGDGTFQPVATLYDSGGVDPNSVILLDVDGDGKQDLVVGNCGSNTGCGYNVDGALGVLLGNGDGSFQPVVPYSSGGTISNRSWWQT